MQYTVVDDDVEAATIYRYDGKAPQPARPHESHGLQLFHNNAFKVAIYD